MGDPVMTFNVNLQCVNGPAKHTVMKSTTLAAVSPVLVCFVLVGCATLDTSARRGGLSGHTARGKNLQKAALNEYMAEKQRILPSIPRDAKGLQQTWDIVKKVESEVATIRIRLGDRSASWPEYRVFADQLRATRRHQLDALLPVWQEALRTGSPVAGTPYLIFGGEFSDRQHPAHPVAIAVERRARQSLAEAADKKRGDRIEAGGRVWAEQSRLAAEEKHKLTLELIAKGICPVCEGRKQVQVLTERDCASCGGASRSFNGRSCRVCLGSGYFLVPKDRECSSCAGSGIYRAK